MATGTIVLVGNLPPRVVDHAALEFDWSVEKSDSFAAIERTAAVRRVVAVLFEPHSFGISWELALKSVLNSAPAALPIACHHFSEAIDWPALAAGGAFHAIWLPFSHDEVRQSLGFVWEVTFFDNSRNLKRKRASA